VSVSRQLGAAVSAAGLIAAACGGPSYERAQRPAQQHGGASLNTTTVANVVESFIAAGLPARNVHDVTGEKCPKAGCIDAVDTDTVSVMKFPSTGTAERYAGSVPNMYLVEDLVLVFAAGVAPDTRGDYQRAAKRSIG
jgi:hypothetical protein